MKPIKIIKNDVGTFWNRNDGTNLYSRDIIDLLDYLNIKYLLEGENGNNNR